LVGQGDQALLGGTSKDGRNHMSEESRGKRLNNELGGKYDDVETSRELGPLLLRRTQSINRYSSYPLLNGLRVLQVLS